VLNLSESAEIIAKYLAHPKTEPDYRLGRKHSEFIISLTELGYSVDNKELERYIESAIRNSLKNLI
ncbi:MAG: hypothetical protein PHF99_12750, partial [Bacteroidales bacterium]|nr:hypothetical protein [Bacteroidales bacterium]